MTRTTRTTRALAVSSGALVALLALSACGSRTDDEASGPSAEGSCVETDGDSVKIGFLNSLSGTMAISEQTVRDSLDLAAKEINAAGGVLGKQLTVVGEDGQSEPTVFAEKAEKLIKSDCVAAVFGGWTSSSRKAMLPDQALRLLYNQVNVRFDERIVRLFAGVMGLYPVGSTVRLSSGELAIVVQVSGEPAAFAKPRVKVFRSAQGQPADFLVDLMAAGETRTIAASVDPSEVQINVPQFLLA